MSISNPLLGDGYFDETRVFYMSHEGFFMARQPIYDRDMRLSGYELLYRSANVASAGALDENAEIMSLANILVEVGLEKLVGKSCAFVNVPARLLGSEALRLLPPGQVTLEILEDTPWSDEVRDAIEHLKMFGYRLALDDYIFEAKHEPFLKQVDLVKIDIMGMSRAELCSRFPVIRRPDQVYLAEKVETHEEFELCLNLGFDLFQGYFFAKPNTIKGNGIPANYSLLISLLARLQEPEIELDELESLIASNVALCHKVLRLVNSASVGLARPVETIKQAIVFLGISRIRTLATLAIVTSMTGKPPELYALAMVRARFCEDVARSSGFDSPDKHFTAGLLSILDALTDTPMNEVISELPLSAELAETLCGTSDRSPCARTLQSVLAFERGQFDGQNVLDLNPNTYLEAVKWAKEQELSLAA